MTTSSNEPAAAPLAGVRARLPFAAPGVRAAVPVRVFDRTAPPPPPPKLDLTPFLHALEVGFASVRAQQDAAFQEIEKECVALALAAAERVVRRRCEAGELELAEPLAGLLGARRRELAEQPATLRLHPKDAEVLEPRLAEFVPAGATVKVVADPAQARGSLSLEHGAARVTRTLAHELVRLRASLLAEHA